MCSTLSSETNNMANAPDPIKHLPLLYNPLLNALFNNPFHATAPTKLIIRELAEKHTDYTILVPPSYILNNNLDARKRKLADLCYNDDEFVRSHIIKSATPVSVSTAPLTKSQLIIYDTMNGRQVLLRGGTILTGKNFKKTSRVKIISVHQFVSFCDYLPKGSRFLLIFIEDALLYSLQPQETLINKDSRFGGTELGRNRKQDITFEELLRRFPLLSKTLSQKFYTLFHHNNRKLEKLRTRHIMKLSEIINEFRSFEMEIVSIIQDCINADTPEGERLYNIFDSVVTLNPDIDMNALIHEYVELNLYDKIWQQLVYQYDKSAEDGTHEDPALHKNLTPKLYKDLSCLSLNQLDVPVEEPWKLNILQSRITESIDIISKLQAGDAFNQKQKVAIIREAINALTNGTAYSAHDKLVIDADTLIGLLIMVVVHSKIQDLEAHLVYIRFFGVLGNTSGENKEHPSKNLGYLSYILSNFDAVVYLLSSNKSGHDGSHLSNMINASASNYEFWYAIKTENEVVLRQMLDSINEMYGNREIPRSHFIRSRNIHGESCFVFAAKTKNLSIFKTLLDYTRLWILFEDLVFDKNTTTEQNLLMIALQEEAHDIALEIIDVINENATIEERKAYYNSQDKNGRTVGHYLAHNLDALDAIGKFIDWNSKDKSSQTPLIALCRCYDHPDYKLLVQKAFYHVFSQDQKILTFDKHIDKAGNTLLHILARGIKESKLLSSNRALIDINQLNYKQFTPMSLYVRYSRPENLRVILQQQRLIFDKEDQKQFYNVADYYSFSASKLSTGSNGDFPTVQSLILKRFFEEYYPSNSNKYFGILNARLDNTLNDWLVNIIHFRRDSHQSFHTKYVAMDTLYQFYHYHKRASVLKFFPQPKAISENFIKGKSFVPMFVKYCMNRNLEYLNAFISSVHFLEPWSRDFIYQRFSKFLASDSNLTSELFSKKNEEAESDANNVLLTHSKVADIVYFVEYSQDDVRYYLSSMQKIRKLFCVSGIKQCERRFMFDRFMSSLYSRKDKEFSAEAEIRTIDASSLKIEPFCLWLELCAEELLKNCSLLLAKVTLWKVIYSKIRELNNDLVHIEEQIIAGAKESNLDTQSSQAQAPRVSRTNSLNIELTLKDTDIPEDSPFFSFGLVDGKRARYKKIVTLKSENLKQLMELNQEIKIEHERLASSISQFITFRSSYFSFGLKQLTKASLLLAQNRRFELEKCLLESRTCSLNI